MIIIMNPKSIHMKYNIFVHIRCCLCHTDDTPITKLPSGPNVFKLFLIIFSFFYYFYISEKRFGTIVLVFRKITSTIGCGKIWIISIIISNNNNI